MKEFLGKAEPSQNDKHNLLASEHWPGFFRFLKKIALQSKTHPQFRKAELAQRGKLAECVWNLGNLREEVGR